MDTYSMKTNDKFDSAILICIYIKMLNNEDLSPKEEEVYTNFLEFRPHHFHQDGDTKVSLLEFIIGKCAAEIECEERFPAFEDFANRTGLDKFWKIQKD